MCKVLVIDDEKLILNLLKQALQRLDYSVVTAADGRNGIDKFDSGTFDLVITDICMPDTDGNHVVNHIRRSQRGHVPVIGMSGTPWKLTSPLFDRVLPKPFQLDRLTATARSLTSMEH